MGLKKDLSTVLLAGSLLFTPTQANPVKSQNILPDAPKITDIVDAHGNISLQIILDLLNDDDYLREFLQGVTSSTITLSTDDRIVDITITSFEGHLNRFVTILNKDFSLSNDPTENITDILANESGFTLEKISYTETKRLTEDDIENINSYFSFYLHFELNGEYYFKKTVTLDPRNFQKQNDARMFIHREFLNYSIGHIAPDGNIDEGLIISKNNVDVPLSVEVRGVHQPFIGPLKFPQDQFLLENLNSVFGITIPGLLPPDQSMAA